MENEKTTNNSMKVYRKTVKINGREVTVYSATRSDNSSVSLIFKCPITTESVAFEISNVIGNLKLRRNTKDGIDYTNYTYYITSCDFAEIKGEPLPL